jgi:hypothetical protein
MAIIKTGTGSDFQRNGTGGYGVTLLRSDGALLSREYSGIYRAKIEIIPTTVTANTTYFAMRNLGAKKVYLRRINVQVGFSGTAVASRGSYSLCRFGSATPTGGVAETIIKTRNSWPTSSVTDIRAAPGGLTTTSVVFEAPFHLITHTNQLNIDREEAIEQDAEDEDWTFELAVNEGFCIRAYTALVAGSYLTGSVVWAERT